jgi:ATP-dependent protease ClpP protease subunit
MNQARPMRCHIRAEATVTRVDVFDDIGEGSWCTPGLTAKDFAAQLAGVKGPLDVHINSYGGDVGQGIAIGNTIRSYKGFKRTVVDGMAASIASVIAQAGDERVVEPGSMTFVHDAWGGCTGNAADMAKTAADLNKHSDNLAEIYASRAGGTVQHWRDVMQAETWYTAEEAVAAGLADKVGTGQAALPAGMDLAAFTAIPGRIAARLREMPVAKPQDAATHEPVEGSHTHAHPAYGSQGSDAMHSHKHSHSGEASHNHSHDGDGASDSASDSASGQDCPTCKGTGKIMEGNRECPDCKGTGKKTAATGSALTADDVLALIRHELQAASGKPGTHAGHERWDPDNDGDCDACPDGDTDHDYWTAAGKQLKSVPGKPMPAGDAVTEERVRAIFTEMAARGAPQFLGKIPDAVKTQFLKDLKNDSPTDIAAGMRRLSQWAASGHYPTGTTYDDLKWFYDQCAKELKSRDPDSEAGGNFPPKSSDALGTPLDAAADPGIRACHALVTALEAIREAAGGESSDSAGGGPEDSAHQDVSGIDLEQIRTAFSALKGAIA